MQIIRTITQQQELFCAWVSTPLRNIADHCNQSWSDPVLTEAQLTRTLMESMKQLPQYALCYLISPEGIMMTPTISHQGCEWDDLGKDVSERPYFKERIASQPFYLSPPYISTKTNLPCMTAVQSITRNGELFALLAIDFDGSAKPHTTFGKSLQQHTQIKGDPSIRQQLFAQTRTITPMEEQIDTVHHHATELLHHHGAFHVQLRYSRSTTNVRFTERPYHDSLFTLEELLHSSSANRQPISAMATVDAEQIPAVLALFKQLRLADENIYLRSGSINIISGMVELNFSCDGTHCLPMDEFLAKRIEFWLAPGSEPKATKENTTSFTASSSMIHSDQNGVTAMAI